MKTLTALISTSLSINLIAPTGGPASAQEIATSDSVKAKQIQESAETALMLSQFERSYVTTTDVRGKQPHLVFEGSIAPPFVVVSPRKNFALVAIPKVVLRMYLERSVPVKTPSYMPRVTVYKFFHLKQSLIEKSVVSYASLTISHHSNGEAGPFRNSDGTINHESGNFSTNFVEPAYVRGGPIFLGVEGQARFSAEIHPPGWYDRESNVGYSHFRLHLSATTIETPNGNTNAKCFVGACARDFTFNYAVTYLGGDVLPKFHGRGRFPLWIEFSAAPTFTPDLTVFVNGYWGQDYYNTYFDQNLTTIRLGMQGRRRSDRSSVQPRGT